MVFLLSLFVGCPRQVTRARGPAGRVSILTRTIERQWHSGALVQKSRAAAATTTLTTTTTLTLTTTLAAAAAAAVTTRRVAIGCKSPRALSRNWSRAPGD